MKRPAVLAAAAALYATAAFAVPPGFFDGFTQQVPYRFVKPPPCCVHNNAPPQAGHMTIKVGPTGQTDPASVFTNDESPQAILSLLPGAFDDPDRSAVNVDITPESAYPDLGGLQCATNIYLFKSSKPLEQAGFHRQLRTFPDRGAHQAARLLRGLLSARRIRQAGRSHGGRRPDAAHHRGPRRGAGAARRHPAGADAARRV